MGIKIGIPSRRSVFDVGITKEEMFSLGPMLGLQIVWAACFRISAMTTARRGVAAKGINAKQC
jgi:hypothetical protein